MSVESSMGSASELTNSSISHATSNLTTAEMIASVQAMKESVDKSIKESVESLKREQQTFMEESKKEQKNFSEKLVEVVLKKLVDYLRSAQKSASSHFDTGMMQLDTVEEDIEEELFFTRKLLLGNKHIDQLGFSKFLSMTTSEKERHCFLEWVTS
jgi:hypothetical protein